MTLTTRLLGNPTAGDDLGPQWAVAGKRTARHGVPVALLRTVAEDPLGGDHLGTLDPAFAKQSVPIDRAWADAQLAADMTWLGLGVGVRVALVPDSGWFQVVLVEVRTRRRSAVGRPGRSPLLVLQRARRHLVRAIDGRGRIEPPKGRPRLVAVDGSEAGARGAG